MRVTGGRETPSVQEELAWAGTLVVSDSVYVGWFFEFGSLMICSGAVLLRKGVSAGRCVCGGGGGGEAAGYLERIGRR